MRILLIGPFGEGLLAQSYARAFERLGHEVFRFDSDRAYFGAAWYAQSRWARRLARRVLWNRINLSTVEVARCVRPAFALVFKGSYMNASTVRRVEDEERIPMLNYYPDHPYVGVPLDPRKTSAQRRDLMQVLRQYSRVYIWENALASRLRADGVRAGYLPFAADPEVYRSVKAGPCKECGRDAHAVVFIGQHCAGREGCVAVVRQHEVGLWGPRWRRARRRFAGRHIVHAEPVVGSRCAALYAAADVSLNMLNEWNVPGHNMRTFEIPASGGAMLSTFTKEQAELFPEGEAALYYRDPAELDALIERLRRDGPLRNTLRARALQIAGQHDYLHRAARILSDVADAGLCPMAEVRGAA